ncbi:MAG: DUF6096 family protein [Eubacteriales bacterium]|nr:DUF6096 family protein [Eubacteriales bacterium]
MNNLGGFDEEIREEEVSEKKVVDLNEERKKRKPFHYWTVGGRDYRLKLKASTIGKLENKYRKNILNLIDDIPPLSVMLTIIQAAMDPWEHGIDYTDVQKLYDKWTEEDGNQTDLFSKVIIPLMAVSGFFPEKQAVAIMEEMGNE